MIWYLAMRACVSVKGCVSRVLKGVLAVCEMVIWYLVMRACVSTL